MARPRNSVAKSSIDDLALFGGQPAFPEPLHVGRPNIGDRRRLHQMLDDILDRRWLSNGGPLVREFERAIEGATGARHAVAVSSATVGLQMLSRALGVDGEVIVPSFTFIGTPHALSWLGLQPIFCDIDEQTLTLDPAMVERLIGPHTSAILGVHLWGRICDTERLEAIGEAAGVPVIYDAAHAFGCSRDGRMVGTFGRAEVLSFHATKAINSFEGGAVCTDDDELAMTLRHMVNFGISGEDRSDGIGTNGKMHEMSAAMGLASLDAASTIFAVNREHAARYTAMLAKVNGLEVLPVGDLSETNAHHVVLRVTGTFPLSRDELQRLLVADGVLARRYFYPGCHRVEPYVDTVAGSDLPVTEALAREVLALPNGQVLRDEDVDAVCALIAFAARHGSAIRERLSDRS